MHPYTKLRRARAGFYVFVIASLFLSNVSVGFVPRAYAAINSDLSQWSDIDTSWQFGNLHGAPGANSAYHEGESVPFQMSLTGMTNGETYFLRIRYDAKSGTENAYDYLTSYNLSRSATAPAGAPTDADVIPVDGGLPFAQIPGSIMSWGGSITSISGPVTDGNEKFYSILFQAGGSDATILWGGHLASENDWGTGNGASSISGAPFHMKVKFFDESEHEKSGGDRSIQPGGILPPVTLNTITLDKVTYPAGDPTSFNFSTTNLPAPTSPILTDATAAVSWSSLADGTYTITENVPAGWDLTSANCTGQITSTVTSIANGVSIALANDETVTCTYTNTKRGHIVIKKTTNPADSTQFDFSASYDQDGFSLSNGQENDSGAIVPGNYTVSETANSNYSTTVACDNGAQGTSSVDVTVAAGQTVTCTFTNTLKQGGITIVKQAVTTQEVVTDVFTFDPSWSESNFTITGSDYQEFSLNLGSYSISEVDVPAGWDLTDATCVDQDQNVFSPDNITLVPDGSVTCTFTNTQRGHLIVHKATVPEADQTEFPITASGTGTITGGGAGTVTDTNDENYEVTPGTYSVTEDLSNLPDWTQTGNSCNSVSVNAGETKECTITNTKKGHIIVNKVTDPAESSQSFHFSTTGSGYSEFDLTDTDTPNDQELEPGTYTVSEGTSLPANWSLESVQCFYGTQSVGISITNGKEIVLDAGDTVTCTFTNIFTTPPPTHGTLRVIKQVVNGDEGDDPSDFSIHVYSEGDVDGSPAAGSSQGVNYNLPAGDYTVQEENPGSSWQVTYGDDDDCASDGDITVVAGETVTCTVTNTFVTQPPTDVCPNLEGTQESLPEGYELVEGQCVLPPTDVCPNIEGTQTSVPSGKVLIDGNCVDEPTPPPPPPPPPPSGGGGGGGFQGLSVFNETNVTVGSPDTTISWFTNISATCTALYGDESQDNIGTPPNYDYDSTAAGATSNGTFHTATLTGIQVGTTYYWRPVCTSTSTAETKLGQQLTFALGPVVLGIEAPVEENVKVLGFEVLPKTGGVGADYYGIVTSMFATVMSGLYVTYRRRSRRA